MKKVKSLLLCISLMIGQSAMASPSVDALSTCLADSTSGKDRKDLVSWVFLAMSAHPDLSSLSAATAVNHDEADYKMAALVTRLLSVNCVQQTKEVAARDGHAGMTKAFTFLGQVAMRELMSNADVTASVGRYAKYLDKQKFESAFSASK